MGAPTGVDVEAIRAENDQLKKEKDEMSATIDELNARVGPCALLCWVVVRDLRLLICTSVFSQLAEGGADE